MEFYSHVLNAKKENKVYAIASVVQTEGNTPRKPGAKMLVYADGTVHGSVGGGIVADDPATPVLGVHFSTFITSPIEA